VVVLEFLLPLISLGAVQLLAVISPGQSFLVISKLALSAGRPPAMMAAIGMGVGSVVWATAAIAGLALILEQAVWLYALLKVAGGLYLLYLAFLLWWHAATPLTLENGRGGATSLPSAFMIGLLTQLANPKVVVFFGSIFFALLPAHAPLWVYVASLAIVFCNETIWYSAVSVALSNRRSRNLYLGAKSWIDRIMGAALGTIGVKLIASAFDAAPRPH
jgi:threonine efflux protein